MRLVKVRDTRSRRKPRKAAPKTVEMPRFSSTVQAQQYRDGRDLPGGVVVHEYSDGYKAPLLYTPWGSCEHVYDGDWIVKVSASGYCRLFDHQFKALFEIPSLIEQYA